MKAIYGIRILLTFALLLCAACALQRPELDSETIQIQRTAQKHKYRVIVDMYFSGHITANNVATMFFPETSWFRLQDFSLGLGGTVLPAQYERAPVDQEYVIQDSSHTFPAIFRMDVPEGLASSHMHIEYQFVSPFVNLEREGIGRGHYLEYILVSGSTWNETIRRLDFSFDPGQDCHTIRALPEAIAGICQEGRYIIGAEGLRLDRNISFIIADLP